MHLPGSDRMGHRRSKIFFATIIPPIPPRTACVSARPARWDASYVVLQAVDTWWTRVRQRKTSTPHRVLRPFACLAGPAPNAGAPLAAPPGGRLTIFPQQIFESGLVLGLPAGAGRVRQHARGPGLAHPLARVGFHGFCGRKTGWLAFRHGKNEYGIDSGVRKVPESSPGSRAAGAAHRRAVEAWKSGSFSTRRSSSARTV